MKRGNFFGCVGSTMTLVIALLVVGSLHRTFAQSTDREIRADVFTGKRPVTVPAQTNPTASTAPPAKPTGRQAGRGGMRGAGNRSTASTAKVQPPKPSNKVYRADPSFSVAAPRAGRELRRLGVTIWRATPDQCRGLNGEQALGACAEANGGKGLFDTASRMEEGAIAPVGNLVRVGLEPISGAGYLYVVDREKFADGSFGEPYLIYPTLNISAGINWAAPGQLLDLPRPGACFCIAPRQGDQPVVADVLTVVFSPAQLLADGAIGTDAIPLPDALLQYLRVEAGPVARADLAGGVKLPPSEAEAVAGGKGLFDTAPTLTRNDLPPQTIYQTDVARGAAGVFTVTLRYR